MGPGTPSLLPSQEIRGAQDQEVAVGGTGKVPLSPILLPGEQVGRGRAGHAHAAAGYLTGPGSPSMQLTTWNFSRSQKRIVLQREPHCDRKPVSSRPPHRPMAWEASFLQIPLSLGQEHKEKWLC